MTSYIEEKLEDRKEYQEQKNKKGTVFSNKIFSASATPKKTMEKASKSMIFAEDESVLKIESIVKKWRPASKEDRKVGSTDLKRQP